MRRIVIAAAIIVAAAAGWSLVSRSPSGVPDRELGLRKTTLTDDQAPAVVVFAGEPPGSNQLAPRAYAGAPPIIPHSLDGLVPITREDNLCVLCHSADSADKTGPPPVPRSHLIDWRGAPGVVRESVAGARWNCTACHVAQSTSPALVPNTFGAAGR